MSVKCVLFDLDGTLVSTGGAGNRALEKAFLFLYGVPHAMQSVNPAGKTDPAIIREIYLKLFQKDCGYEELESIQKKYLDFLPESCNRSKNYHVMQGIPELLNQLRKRKVLMGLGTGNMERGARIKLTRADLNHFFPFGGFGSDSENRVELLKIGRKRAERLSGKKLDPKNVFIIGDTERDIVAAQKAKFKVIAVATGHTLIGVLKKFKPDFLLPNFKCQNDFLNIIQRNGN